MHRKAQKGSNPNQANLLLTPFAWEPIDFSSRVMNLSSRTIRLRQPAKWRDRQEVNHTGTIEERLAAMTPEERARDAIELVERVRARLTAFRTIEHKPEE